MKKQNMFWGLLLILTAVLIIVNQFGFLTGISIFDIVLSVFMVGIIVVSVKSVNFWGILFPLAIICILYADELNITGFTPWPALLTALLLSIGLSLIFGKKTIFMFHCNGVGSSTINEQDDKVVNCTTSFGECIKYVNSEDFERANINCSFGEVRVYFDNAKIPSGKAVIYLNVSFGEAILYIPSNWKIINQTQSFFADMDDCYRQVSVDSPEVTLIGNISFGDVSVRYI